VAADGLALGGHVDDRRDQRDALGDWRYAAVCDGVAQARRLLQLERASTAGTDQDKGENAE
jgi:hypothetical protein